MLTEEVEDISRIYSKKFGISRDLDWFVLKLQEELGELIQSYLMMKGKARSKGKSPEEIKEDFDKEVADVLCHALLLSKHADVDLESTIKKKWLVYKISK